MKKLLAQNHAVKLRGQEVEEQVKKEQEPTTSLRHRPRPSLKAKEQPHGTHTDTKIYTRKQPHNYCFLKIHFNKLVITSSDLSPQLI